MATATMTGTTGRLFEWEVLGRALTIPSGQGYLPYREAMALARRHPAWDPSDPDPRPANDLHFWLCEELGVEDFSRVRLYSALGTPFDIFHGVDLWVEVDGQVVTIDLTANENKDYHKADVVVHPEDLEDGGKALAANIASLLRRPRASRRP